MSNPYRQLDILLFRVDQPVQLEEMNLKVGWNQLIRNDKRYDFRLIENNQFYTSLSTEKTYEFTTKMFGENNIDSNLN